MLNKEFPIVQERLTAITELINYAHKKNFKTTFSNRL